MKQSCNICGVIKTESPDMCDCCHASINTLDYIQRMLFTFKDSRGGAGIAKMIEELSLIRRDSITTRIDRIEYRKGENGERMPGLMHAPYVSRYTNKYAAPGGLMKFIADMVNYHDRAVVGNRDEYLRLVILHAIPHSLSAYQYLDPNGQGKPFKSMPRRFIDGGDTILEMSRFGIELIPTDIPFLLGDDDRVLGMGANVMAGILSLLRGA